jgi:uncharacterized RDD family membrane protein YckC
MRTNFSFLVFRRESHISAWIKSIYAVLDLMSKGISRHILPCYLSASVGRFDGLAHADRLVCEDFPPPHSSAAVKATVRYCGASCVASGLHFYFYSAEIQLGWSGMVPNPSSFATIVARMNEKPSSNYASFGQRLAAFLLDVIILGIAGFIVVFFWTQAFVANGVSDRAGLQAMSFILRCVVCWIYFAAMESSPLQGTLGKLALGIKVTDLGGSPVSFGCASGRYFSKYVSSIILGVGWLLAAFAPKSQALHDMMAGTVVSKRGAAAEQVRAEKENCEAEAIESDADILVDLDNFKFGIIGLTFFLLLILLIVLMID